MPFRHNFFIRIQLSPDHQTHKTFGFIFDRQAAGCHEIWYNEANGRYTTIPNHPGDMPEGTLRAILRQAGIDPQDFLSK